MPLHLGQRVLPLHATRDTPGIVERIAHRGPDGEVREGWYFGKSAQKLIPVLLASGAGGRVHLRIARSRLRQCELLRLFEGRRRRRETAFVCYRLFDELID